jgi:hypothetical protein
VTSQGKTLQLRAETGQQAADAQYCANGTINQVLAGRAASARVVAVEAVFRAVAICSGNVISTTNPELSSAAPPPAVAEPRDQLKKQVLDEALRTIEDSIKTDDQRHNRGA